MPQANFSPALIKQPHCPRCTSRMMLARISPGPLGFEHRRFECPTCASIENEVVADEIGIRWIASRELRAPT
jgi:Zn finger protein HypA/HybF involved in hydrogenase expression